jgi:adenine C2-methylase RlmN of 23S rRNA A2503 and tRNA A37
MDGFVRNPIRSEILEQLLRLNALLPNHERLTHLVVMGIGDSSEGSFSQRR